jgi:ABC-type glutathione transport system ATPase component
VNGISFVVYPGEAVGLVGESGCGKTTTARCILRLEEPTGGRILFDGQDLAALPMKQVRALRRDFQMVFQDPNESLNPRFRVQRTLREPLYLHGLYRDANQLEDIIERVNLEHEHLSRYPHQLSGGQKQRVGVARAVITGPQFVVLDEPTSSLDMSLRIHMIALLRRLQRDAHIAYLFISHDLSTVRHLCDRVLVMYLGRSSRPDHRGCVRSSAPRLHTGAALRDPDPGPHGQTPASFARRRDSQRAPHQAGLRPARSLPVCDR